MAEREQPVVHVPINVHVGMTNQIATLQKEVEKLQGALDTCRELRDYDIKEISTLKIKFAASQCAVRAVWGAWSQGDDFKVAQRLVKEALQL